MFFNFKKNKSKELKAPCSGEIIKIEEVNDPVFAQKMMGDGFAIKTTANTFHALGDGEISAIFPSNHAYGITLNDGLEILVHIGLDTVEENGKGFTCSHKLGDKVTAGEEIVTIDREYLESKGYDLTTMVIFTNPSTYTSFDCKYGEKVTASEDVVASYK